MIERKRISFKESLNMLSSYARIRIMEQIRSVAFIIIYLIIFQTLILGVPISNALSISFGLAMVVFGLAFFLEGLILGLMPLGERVGVKLPTRAGISIIALFGLLLGFGATFAEPAISSLRLAGSNVTAWESPLLYLLLQKHTEMLVLFVGIGVGIAVALGMFRFYYNWSIKPFIYTIVPLLLALSAWGWFDENLRSVIGLAWDCGAVTTGAVTVPLVLALGIGVSRASGKGKGSSGGFGIILLASLFPIISVLILSIFINMGTPRPTSEAEFFSPENKENALSMLGSEEKIRKHAFTLGSEEARKAYYNHEATTYETALKSMAENPEALAAHIGKMSLFDWIANKASENERRILSGISLTKGQDKVSPPYKSILLGETLGGIRSVIPLTILLLLVLLLFLREKLRYKDEIALGITFTLIGIILLTSGIKLGLTALGGEVGEQLPKAFASEEKFVDRMFIEDFDKNLLITGIAPDGSQKSYFYLLENDDAKRVAFDQARYNEHDQTYEHIITREPLFSEKLSILGIVLVLLFAFGLGYGATNAEPALNALGITVEGLTVGAVKRGTIVQIVSIGVGMGILLGLSRILFELPLIWLIIPSYLLLLVLTFFSEEEFTAIAWDSGGVTTGPVTVPLVLAMGLGIGLELGVADGFGILAMASVFPIITVLLYSLYTRAKQKSSIKETNETSNGQG